MIVYKATNKINNKVYIGITTKTLEHRMKIHLRDSKNKDTYFYRAIRKYGFDNFTWEIIDTASTVKELEEKEKYYISIYNSFDNKELGYNTQSGGHNLYKITNEERMNRSVRVRGENNPMYGKPGTWLNKKFSEAHKLHISNALKGMKKDYMRGGNNPSARSVINMTTGEIFDTVLSAAESVGANYNSITKTLKKEEKIFKGCYWEYLDNIDVNNIKLKTPDIDKCKRKRVMCIENGMIFESITNAAEYFECSRKKIRDACNLKIEFKGKHFKFIL